MNNFILVIIGLLFSIYGIVCAVECGAGLALVNPRLSSNSKAKQFVPDRLWQTIDMLVMLLLATSFILVRKSYFSHSQAVVCLLVIGFIALLIRLMISSSAFKNKVSLNKARYLALSYLIPLSLSMIGIYAITGDNFWSTFVGWTLLVSAVFGLSVIGLSFYNREKAYLKRTKLRQYIDSMFCAWVVLLGFVYPVGLQHYNPILINTPMSIMNVVIIVGVLGYALTAIKQKKSYELYQFTILIGLAVPLLLALNNHPYLISLKISLSKAFSLNSYPHSVSWLLYVFVILASLVVLLSLYALGRSLDIWNSIHSRILPKDIKQVV